MHILVERSKWMREPGGKAVKSDKTWFCEFRGKKEKTN